MSWWVRLIDGERVWMAFVPTRGYLGRGRYYFRNGSQSPYWPCFEDFMWTHEPERWK